MGIRGTVCVLGRQDGVGASGVRVFGDAEKRKKRCSGGIKLGIKRHLSMAEITSVQRDCSSHRQGGARGKKGSRTSQRLVQEDAHHWQTLKNGPKIPVQQELQLPVGISW